MKYFCFVLLYFCFILNAHAIVDFPPNYKNVDKINNPTTSQVFFDYRDENLAYVFPPSEMELKRDALHDISENIKYCQTMSEILKELPKHTEDSEWEKTTLEKFFQYGRLFGGKIKLHYLTHLDDNIKILQTLNPNIRFQKIDAKNITIKVTGGYLETQNAGSFPLISYSFDGKVYNPPSDNIINLYDNIRNTYTFDLDFNLMAVCPYLFPDFSSDTFIDDSKYKFHTLSLTIFYKYDAIKTETGYLSFNFYKIYQYLDSIPDFTKIYGHSLSKKTTIADLKQKNLIRMVGSSATMEFILNNAFTSFIEGYQNFLIDLNKYYQQMLNGPDTPAAKNARIDLYNQQAKERLSLFQQTYDKTIRRDFIIPKTVTLSGSMLVNASLKH